MRAWLDATGALPCNVKVLAEGEEEIGSPGLAPFLTAHAAELQSDVLLLADAGNWKVGVPGLTYSLRGLASVDVRVRALDGPVHSGMAGGVVPDPILGLASMLATLVDEHGDPAFDDCWDDYEPPDAAERARLDALPPQRRPPAHRLGPARRRLARRPSRHARVRAAVAPAHGHRHRDRRPPDRGIVEPDRGRGGGTRQRAGRPRGRIPARLNEALRLHFERRVPHGLELTVTPLEAVPAWHTDPTGWAFDAATRALRAGFGVDPVCMGVGGTIPFVGPFAEAFGGIPSLLLGPADPSSRIHGEDESLHLGDWHSLIRSEIQLLAELAANDTGTANARR